MSTDEISVRNAAGVEARHHEPVDELADGFKRLRAAFPPEHVGKLPRGKAKGAPKGTCKPRSEGGDAPPGQDFYCGKYHALPAVHLDYVGHAAATDRLLEVDPFWNWEPIATDEQGRPIFERDGRGNPVGLWIRLTVLGVTRLGYGSVEVGKWDPEKQLIGDALRNAAMRFGVALDMWIKGHADEEDEREAPPAIAPPPVPPAGFSSDEEAKAAHNEAAALWRTIPDELRPEIPKDWPTTREGLDAFNAQINQALATALGASETLDGPDTPPALSEAESGAHGEPELPPAATGHVDTPDIGSVGANGNESDGKIAKLRIEMEVSTMPLPAVIAELEAVGLSPAGPPPKLKQRLVEHRLSVLANDR